MYEDCFLQTRLSKTLNLSVDQKTRQNICLKTCGGAFERLSWAFKTLNQTFEGLRGFRYCTLIWIFRNRHFNYQHERVVRLKYNYCYFSYSDIFEKDNSLSIHHNDCWNVAKVYIYICILNVFQSCYALLFSNYLILNLCDNLFIFIICAKCL